MNQQAHDHDMTTARPDAQQLHVYSLQLKCVCRMQM